MEGARSRVAVKATTGRPMHDAHFRQKTEREGNANGQLTIELLTELRADTKSISRLKSEL